MTDVFLGLDGEMTGGDVQPPGARPHYQKYALVQIGLAYIDTDGLAHWFSSVIGHERGSFEMEPEAMAVHGISEQTIHSAVRAREVDAPAAAWMDELGLRRAVPVGFSVGSFDMPYVRETLPELSKRISMRCVDLNALVFAIRAVTGYSYNAVKASGKNYAEKRIKLDTAYPEKRAHDAGYDALTAIYSFLKYQQMLVVRETHDHL